MSGRPSQTSRRQPRGILFKMQRGVVVSFEADRGFGFIRSGDQEKDVFVHVTDVVGGGTLHPGQRVQFDTRMDERGPRAILVRPGRRGPELSRTRRRPVMALRCQASHAVRAAVTCATA